VSLYDGWDPPRPGWTCDECGFDFDATALDSVGETIRGFGRRFRPPLLRGLAGEDLDGLVRRRPAPATWSPLEYACHVRDALALYNWRIGRTLAEDRPELPAMRRDDVVTERAYNEQDRETVARELADAAERLATRVDAVAGDQWDRCCLRDGDELSVAWMAKNAVHEGSHHLLDIGRALRELRNHGGAAPGG
jgi:DinB family protein